MHAAMIPSRTADATTHFVVSRDGLASARRSGKEEAAEPDDDGHRAQPLLPSEPEAEPAAEDEQQEQELGGQHGLDHAELAEPEGGGLQPEDDQHQPEPDEPDAPPDGMGHQAEAEGGRLGRGLDPDPLEHRGQGIDESGESLPAGRPPLRCTRDHGHVPGSALSAPGLPGPDPAIVAGRGTGGDEPIRPVGL